MVFLLHLNPILFNVLASLEMEIVKEFNINLMVAVSNASSGTKDRFCPHAGSR